MRLTTPGTYSTPNPLASATQRRDYQCHGYQWPNSASERHSETPGYRSYRIQFFFVQCAKPLLAVRKDPNIGLATRLTKVIVDRGVRIPEGLVGGEDPSLDAQRFRRTDKGVCLITQRMIGKLSS
jgi:hypothetical protein